ncbi:hypothetical protein YC2023_059730 [Brassica napus]
MNRRALCLEPDKNKQCNLAICLMRMGRIREAKPLIDAVRDSSAEIEFGDEPFTKSYDRAVEMLAEVESKDPEDGLSDKFYAGCSFANGTMKENKAPRNANMNHSHHLLDKRERGSVGPRMDETGPYLPTEKVDQLQSSDTRERKVVLLQLGL